METEPTKKPKKCFCTVEEGVLGHSCENSPCGTKRFMYDKIPINLDYTIVYGRIVESPIEACEKYQSGEYSKSVIKLDLGAVATSECINLSGVERKRLRKQRKLENMVK